MTVTEFKSYLEKGLGRAILLLKAEPDKTPFREAAFRYLTSGYFNGVTYALDLIDCFDDRDALAKEVAAQNLMQGKTFEEACDVPLLTALGYQKEYTELIEDHYRTFRENMLSLSGEEPYTQEIGGIGGRYLGAVYGILYDTEVTQERVRAMFPDWIAYFAKAKAWNLHPHDAASIFQKAAPLWQNQTEEMLKEIAALPGGEGLIEQITRWEMPPPNPAITVEDILSRLPLNRFASDHCRASFCLAAPAVVKEIAEIALTADDLTIRSDLLSLFRYPQRIHNGEIISPPAFPFPDRLVSLVTEEALSRVDGTTDDENTAFLFQVLLVINTVCHPQAAALGKRLRHHSCPIFHGYGWSILGNNYTAEDREELMAALSESKDIENGNGTFYSALGAMLHAAERSANGLPLDLLPSFWTEMPYDGWRQKIAEILLKYDRMPDDIRKECRYDRGEAIRKLVKESS